MEATDPTDNHDKENQMSTSINVHPTTSTDRAKIENRVTATVKTDAWPRNLIINYEQGGPGIEGNHSTCIFIGSLKAQAIRDLASSMEHASTKLFEYANILDEYGNDSREG
jgi:hypothetical protein